MTATPRRTTPAADLRRWRAMAGLVNCGPLTLRDIANRIDGYLTRFERMPSINQSIRAGAHPFYEAQAWQASNRVAVRYVGYQGVAYLTRQAAIVYLAALDAGRNVKHHALRVQP